MTRTVERFSRGKASAVVGVLLSDTTVDQFRSYILNGKGRVEKEQAEPGGHSIVGTVEYKGAKCRMFYAHGTDEKYAIVSVLTRNGDESNVDSLIGNFLDVTGSKAADDPSSGIYMDVKATMRAVLSVGSKD